MKVCPTCQRKYPDLISTCPDDQGVLVDGAVPAATSKASAATPATAAKKTAPAAAPAPASADEKPDTRSLEERLFAPLPNRPAAAPAPPSVKMPAAAPPPVKPAATPAPAPSPSATSKMSETVFDDAPQKSSKIPAIPSAKQIPWNKVLPVAGLLLVIVFAIYFIAHKSRSSSNQLPPTDVFSTDSSGDVDMELSLRDLYYRSPALRNQDIQVRVRDGSVTLSGQAASTARIEEAVKVAKGMAGVKEVVSYVEVNPSVGVRSVGHSAPAATSAGLGSASAGEQGVAAQARARELTVAGDRAMAKGDYRTAASFYRQAVALNPNDSAASLGYTRATERLQR